MRLIAIYVNRNGQQLGPYDSLQINRLLRDRELSPEDLGWHKGLEEWVPLGQLKALSAPVKASSSQTIAVVADGPSFATGHISYETQHFQAIGTCWYALALVLGIIGTPLVLYALPRKLYFGTIGGSILLIAAFVYGFIGNGVRNNRRWAQPASVLGAIILLPVIPFGTLLGLYVLTLLKKARNQE